MLARIVNDDVLAVRRAALLRNGDLLGPGKEPARERCGVSRDLLRRAHRHEVAPQLPRPRTQIDHEVGGADGLLVVLHDEDGIAEVTQAFEGIEQAAVVPLMETDAGLVEDVEHTHEARPDLGRQAYPLPLAPRERGGGPIERQVLEPHVSEEAQALADLLEHPARDLGVPLRERQRVEELPRRFDREAHHIGDGAPRDLHGQRLRTEPGTLTGRAVPERHEMLELLPHLG